MMTTQDLLGLIADEQPDDYERTLAGVATVRLRPTRGESP